MTGPRGVQLLLKKTDSDDHVVKQTSTSVGGDFVFEKVLPGEFVIEASRSPWIFDVVCCPLSVLLLKNVICFFTLCCCLIC